MTAEETSLILSHLRRLNTDRYPEMYCLAPRGAHDNDFQIIRITEHPTQSPEQPMRNDSYWLINFSSFDELLAKLTAEQRTN